MKYIDSPNRRSDHNNTSPITLFDSPSLTGNRFNYQALSCESPPANFEDLRTPVQVSRRPLDSNATSTAIATLQRSIFSPTVSRFNIEAATVSVTNKKNKIEEEKNDQQQNTVTSPIKTKTTSPIVYKSTLNSPLRKNMNWINKGVENKNDNNIEENEKEVVEKDLMALDVSPINTVQKTEYKFSHSTPIRQTNNNNNNTTSSSDTSSPIKFSPIAPLSSKEINNHSNKSSTSTSGRSQQHFDIDKDLHYKKSPITETYQPRFSFDKDFYDNSNNKKSPITTSSISERSQHRFSFDKDRDYTINRTNLTKNTASPIKNIFDDEKDKDDKKIKEDDHYEKQNKQDDKVNEKSNDEEDKDDSLSFLQKPYSERIKKSSSTTATTNVYSRFTFQFSPTKQENNDDDSFEYSKPSTSTSPRSHLQPSPIKYQSSPQRHQSSPLKYQSPIEKYQSSPQRHQSSPKKQLTSTYRSPVYSNSSYKSSDKKESPNQTNQKSVTSKKNNTDDTIKQPSSSSSTFFMKSPFSSSTKTDNNIGNEIRSPYTSRATYSHNDNNNNNNNIGDEGDDNVTKDNVTNDSVIKDNDTKDNSKNGINNIDEYNINRNNNQQKNKNANSNSQLSTIISSSAITNGSLKNDDHSEIAIQTQTSSQDSISSNRSSRQRYKHVKGGLPHYMLPTESYQHHIQSTSEHNTKLHKTISRGVTKKSTTNVSRFKSSTKINAIDDIRKEMLPDDVYIPLAARIKLFEKGLGNGIKPTPINNQKQSNTSHSNGTARLTKPKSPVLLTRQRSLSHYCYRSDEPSSSVRLISSLEDKDSSKNTNPTKQRKYTEDPTYIASRDHRVNKRSYSSISSSTSVSNKNDEQVKKNDTKRQKRFDHPPLEVKPFHFATDKRAARYQELFRTKLRLWKDKENEEESQKHYK